MDERTALRTPTGDFSVSGEKLRPFRTRLGSP
jgi:hypothetical protein